MMAALGMSRQETEPPDQSEEELDADALREIDATFAEIEQDLHDALLRLLFTKLQLVRNRRSPVTTLRQAPVGKTARISFADGTAVIGETRPPGHLSTLAMAVLRHRILLEDVRLDPTGVEMRFNLGAGRPFTAWAVGLDQED